METFPGVRVAVVQAAPVLFERETTVAKCCRLIAEAAAAGAQLVLLPEAFIPAYPRGLSFGTVVGSRTPAGRQLWQRYWANSVDVPGPVTKTLGQAAREHNVIWPLALSSEKGVRCTAPCSTLGRTGRCWANTASSNQRGRNGWSGVRAMAPP